MEKQQKNCKHIMVTERELKMIEQYRRLGTENKLTIDILIKRLLEQEKWRN